MVCPYLKSKSLGVHFCNFLPGFFFVITKPDDKTTIVNMEKDLLKVFENFGIQSLIHVGGHKGQEIEFYKSLDLDKVIFFEPVEKFATEIKMKTQSLKNFEVYQLALGNEDIEKELLLAEKEIKNLKESSLESINKIAVETSTEIIKQIIDTDVNKSNVSAIVDDIIKKKMEKHT